MSKQEELWAGKFGDDYHKRNELIDRKKFWIDVLQRLDTTNILTALEVGAGKGDNLRALDWYLLSIKELTGLELNKGACKVMQQSGFKVWNKAVLSASIVPRFDLVVTRGFLMHVPDADVSATLDRIYNWSKRYIILAEYYSPVRREVEYHGHGDALWIDDFAGKMLERYPDLKLIDYGFKYHRDGFGDETFFALEKKQ